MAYEYQCDSWTVYLELERRGAVVRKDKTTSIEYTIQHILDKHNILYEKHNRKVLDNQQELDFYLLEYRLGVECNGLYCHSSKEPVMNRKHAIKFQSALHNNIRLMQFWENDINSRPELVESMILAKCGLLPNRIMARKCNVVDIGITEANRLYDSWHIQGGTVKSAKV